MIARLQTKGDFDRVFARGKSVSSAHLSLRALDRRDDRPTRFGWVVGRQLGGSVARNRLRRRLRGLLSMLDVRPGFDCVVTMRSPQFGDLRAEVTELLEKSGLTAQGVNLDA